MKQSNIDQFDESFKAGKYVTPIRIAEMMESSSAGISAMARCIDNTLEAEWNSLDMKLYRFFLWREKKRFAAEARLSQEWSKLRYKTGLGLKRIGRWFNRKGDNVMQTTPSDKE